VKLYAYVHTGAHRAEVLYILIRLSTFNTKRNLKFHFIGRIIRCRSVQSKQIG